MRMESVIIFLLAEALSTYVFLFQRTTLNIARSVGKYNVSEVQLALTPAWIGALGWAGSIGMLLSVVLVGVEHGVLASVVGIISHFIIQTVTPVPQRHMLTVASNYLLSRMDTLPAEHMEALQDLLEYLESMKKA